MARTQPPRVVRCAACDALAVGSDGLRCCASEMEPLDGDAPVVEPTVEALLGAVFGFTETELDVCLCVMERGDATAAELAEEVGVDRSVVARHLADLTELGVVERERRLLRRGGHVYVYAPAPERAVRERLTAAFAAWVELALAELETVSREKVEAIAEGEWDGERGDRIYR